MNRTLRFGVLPLLAVLVASSLYFQSSDSPKSPPQVSMPQPTPPAASDHPGLLPSPEPGDGHGRMAGRSGAATESMPGLTPPQSVEAFNLWLTRYKAASPADRPVLEAEGRRLAEARLTVLADLVQTNPQRALQSALTYAQRKALPDSIASKVETPINALADLAVLASLPSAEVSSRLPAVLRTVTIDGEAFQAFTYGDGNRWQTRHGMPVSGIAVPNGAASVPFVTSLGRPGQLLALHETPARFVDAAEQADLVAARASTSAPDPLCGVSEQPVTASNTETTVQFGGQHHAFCGKVDAEGWVRARMAALGLDEPGGDLLSLAVSESQYTEGRKRMLLMRPVWSDHRGGMTTNEALSHWQNFSNYMYEMSYGKLVMAPLGKGSSITPSLELPGLVAEYDNTGLGKLYDTCRAVARDVHGYQLDQYDFLYVVTDGKPAASYCGLAYVGGVGFHLANRCWDAAVSAHEFGHNLGLNHAHFWDTKAQSIAGEGQNVEYGDSNDPMGGGNSPNQFNSRYKNYLGWIPDTDILDLNLRGSGLYRLYSFDLNDSSGVRGLKFRRDASQNYWLQFRQRKLDKKALMNGVQLMWSGNGNEGTYLLDVRLKGNADNNAIAIGRTFSDPRVNVHFTPIGKAGTYPEAMDVVVNIGAFPTNQPPAGFVSASSLEVSPGQQVDFRAEASDPNGDALAYFWDFAGQDFSVDNKPTASYRFAEAGEYAVQCSISDMKGGVFRKTLIVRVGAPVTYRITGRVLNTQGLPLGGIKILAGTAFSAWSDSDGAYQLVNLPAGSHVVSALEPVSGSLSFAQPYFQNPVVVGPDRAAIDFVGVAGSLLVRTPLIAKKAAAWRYLDTGVAQPAAWKEATFDDRSWKTGGGILGYGEGGETTTLGFGGNSENKFPTYYFRKSFVVANPTTFTNFAVEVLRDDGVAVYLNGTEFFRDNLPSGALTYNTLASDSVEPDSYLLATLANSQLVAGTNWIAAEVHQSTLNSSDLAFDLAISGVRLTNLTGLSFAYVAQPSDLDRVELGSSVLIKASAFAASAVSRVEFFLGAEKLGETSQAPFEHQWVANSEGTQRLRVIATAGGLQLTSAPVRIVVIPPQVETFASTVIPSGSAWSYLARAAAPPAGWQQPAFDASGWSNAPGALGFGAANLTTTINGGPSGGRFPTIYFRRPFNVVDPGSVQNLDLRVRRDDGIAVYLNGREVFRDNLPPGTLSHPTTATNASDNGALWLGSILQGEHLDYLAPGTNVIAAEVHQSGPSSSDLVFDLRLDLEATAARERGCWITAPSAQSVYTFGETVSMEAEVVAGGTGVGVTKVEFLANGVVIGEDSSAPYRYSWTSASTGPHQLTVRATDTEGGMITSGSLDITVRPREAATRMVGRGQLWKYLDDGSNQGTNWQAVGFNDSTWQMGAAPLGYGFVGTSTTIRNGTNAALRHVTAYFRNSFVVQSPGDYEGVRLTLAVNDGAAVYLNGAEVYRNNLPSSRISYNSLALTRVTGTGVNPPEEIYLSGSVLRQGTNVVAVELHQNSITSPDGWFDLGLDILPRLTAAQAELYITRPADNTWLLSPASVELNAHLGRPLQPGGVVEYWAGESKIGEAAQEPFRIAWSPPGKGTFSVTARYREGGTTLQSQPVALTLGDTPAPISPVMDRLAALSSSWKFWDQATEPVSNWKQPEFEDFSWASGNARLGFGIDGETTTLTPGRPTYYFRKTFQVPKPSAYSHLVFQMIRDDGAVVYVNGREVFRSNMPAGPVSHSTPAVENVNTPEETQLFETVIPINGSMLRLGQNVIAVELHQQSASSSDAAFDLQLLGVGTTEKRVTLLSPGGVSALPSGEPVEAEATAQGAGGGAVTRIEFLANGVQFGVALSAPWRAAWEDAPLGRHKLHARAYFADGTSLDSAEVTIDVARPVWFLAAIPADGVWKYFDRGQNLGTAWRDTGYDDSGWSEGPARLGYGGDGETTLVSFGNSSANKHMTTYFRSRFEVPEGVIATNLAFRYQRDDGLAVYINGRQAFRDNLAANAVFSSAALGDITEAAEQQWITTNILATNLVSGVNVIAAEVHQIRPGSSDLGFALELNLTGYSTVVPPARPVLGFTLEANGDAVFHWPATAQGFQLKTTEDVTRPFAQWTSLGSGVANGNRIEIRVNPSASQAFYRLHRP